MPAAAINTLREDTPSQRPANKTSGTPGAEVMVHGSESVAGARPPPPGLVKDRFLEAVTT